MGKIWIKCLSIVHAEKGGQLTTFRAGDWCKVTKGEARRLLGEGKAEIPEISYSGDIGTLLQNCGTVVWGNFDNFSLIESKYPTLEIIKKITPELAFPKTLLWDGKAKLDPNLIPLGFGHLEKWQLAMPVLDMDLLAENIGTVEDRDQLKEIIHDLRVPIYDVGIIFVRRCHVTKKLLSEWNEIPGDRYLAFLQALYLNPLQILPLPVNWRKNE